MPRIYDYLFTAMWLAFVAYWWVMALNVKAVERRESWLSRRTRLLLMIVAIALLWLPNFPLRALNKRFLPAGGWSFWLGAAITAAGLLFSVWARVHLGSNWSSAVTVKQNHELITTGPYAFARHPIYTGLLLAFIGSAIARAELRGLLAVALVFGIFWYKLKLEERWMRSQFGETYQSYSRRVAALIPYLL